MRTFAAALVATLIAVACSDGGGSSACDRAVREDLDPLAGVHTLGADGVQYLTSPPTSGPHLSIHGPAGLQADPLDEVVQVTVLARGAVLVQYRDAADRVGLEPLVEEGDVVVAPAPELPDAVVATAWTRKLRCDAVDIAALRSFADEFAGGEHH